MTTAPLTRRIPRTIAAAASAAGAMILLSSLPAMAGTGGDNGAGIKYGEDTFYCDVANLSILKVDADSGLPLAGAQFTITPADGVAVKEGTYAMGDKTQPSTDPDKDLWEQTLNMTADALFTATPFGQAWQAAMAPQVESTRTDSNGTAGTADGGATSSTEGTTFTPQGSVTYPPDITDITDPSAQTAAMASWASDNGGTTADAAVQAFMTNLKTRLNALGTAVYGAAYTADDPNSQPPTAGPLVGTTAFDAAYAEYDQMRLTFNNLVGAIRATGYSSAFIAADGTIDLRGYAPNTVNWSEFVLAYDYATDPANFSWGLDAASWDLIAAVIGPDGVAAANTAADDAVGAVQTPIVLTSAADGTVSYSVFGRLGDRGDLTCSSLVTVVQETAAPDGYTADPTSITLTPDNNSAAANQLTFTNTLDGTTTTVDNPDTPVFESGV